VMRGKPKAYWRDVFRVWEREIPKPDFAIHHAAKAVRLLPKVNFTGMPVKHPVLWNLLKRTKDFLQEDNCTMVVEDPSQPRGGRVHRIGLCTEDAAAMIKAALVLQKPIPTLKSDIVPLLRSKVSDAVDAMSNKDVVRMLLTRALHEETVTWMRLLKRLGPELDEAIDIEDIPGMLELLCSEEVVVAAAVALEEGKPVQASNDEGVRPFESGHLLLTLRDQVILYWDSLQLMDIATCFWSLANAKLINEPLQSAASHMVVQKATRWVPKRFDPGVWQLVCSLAKVGRQDAPLLKAVARMALKHDLGTMTNWAVSVMTWSYSQLQRPEDNLGDFRQHLQMELALRGISNETAMQSWKVIYSEDMDEFWLHRRMAKPPLFIAPRPVKLLRRLSTEADLEQAAKVGRLLSRPNWRELDRVDDDDDDELPDLEQFRLFDGPNGTSETK